MQDENASISAGTPTDRLYTNGLRLEWTSPDRPGARLPRQFRPCAVGRRPAAHRHRPVAADATRRSIPAAVPADPHDRPYAGYLTTNLSLLSDTQSSPQRADAQPGRGRSGSPARANLQDSFHDLIGQAHATRLGIADPQHLRLRAAARADLAHAARPFGGLETDVLPALTVGRRRLCATMFRSARRSASARGWTRISACRAFRPGLSGGDAFTPTRPFAWYLFAGVDGQAVGYDLLLQASPFRSGPHVDTIWDVGEMQAGAAIMAYGLRLTVRLCRPHAGVPGPARRAAPVRLCLGRRALLKRPGGTCGGLRRRAATRNGAVRRRSSPRPGPTLRPLMPRHPAAARMSRQVVASTSIPPADRRALDRRSGSPGSRTSSKPGATRAARICALVASIPWAIAAGIAQAGQVDHRGQHGVDDAVAHPARRHAARRPPPRP